MWLQSAAVHLGNRYWASEIGLARSGRPDSGNKRPWCFCWSTAAFRFWIGGGGERTGAFQPNRRAEAVTWKWGYRQRAASCPGKRSAVRWPMQRAAMADAVRCVGSCSTLRFDGDSRTKNRRTALPSVGLCGASVCLSPWQGCVRALRVRPCPSLFPPRP